MTGASLGIAVRHGTVTGPSLRGGTAGKKGVGTGPPASKGVMAPPSTGDGGEDGVEGHVDQQPPLAGVVLGDRTGLGQGGFEVLNEDGTTRPLNLLDDLGGVGVGEFGVNTFPPGLLEHAATMSDQQAAHSAAEVAAGRPPTSVDTPEEIARTMLATERVGTQAAGGGGQGRPANAVTWAAYNDDEPPETTDV
jgi:hypothetical protein